MLRSSWAKLRATPEALSVKRVAAEETDDDEGNYGDIPSEGSIQKKKKIEQRNKDLFISRISTKELFPLSRLVFFFWYSHDIRDSEREMRTEFRRDVKKERERE